MKGTEEIGWMCILGAAPFAACGFFTYHGMTAEQVLWAWFKSEILCPKKLVFKSDSYYYEAMQPTCADCEEYDRCEIIQAFINQSGYKYAKYKQALEYIRAHDYAAFMKAAENWKNAYGKYPK